MSAVLNTSALDSVHGNGRRRAWLNDRCEEVIDWLITLLVMFIFIYTNQFLLQYNCVGFFFSLCIRV